MHNQVVNKKEREKKKDVRQQNAQALPAGQPSKKKRNQKTSNPVIAKKMKLTQPPLPQTLHDKIKVSDEMRRQFLAILRGELTETEFSDEFWGKEPFVSPNVVKKIEELVGEQDCLGMEAIAKVFETNQLFLNHDVSFISYDQETDNVRELNQRGEIESFKNILEVIENESIAAVLNRFYCHSIPLATFVNLFESTFDCFADSLECSVSISPTSTAPTAPQSCLEDTFIFQLEGTQQIHVYNDPRKMNISSIDDDLSFLENNKVSSSFSALDLANQPACQIDTIVLNKGECAYIPGGKSYVIFRESGAESMDAFENGNDEESSSGDDENDGGNDSDGDGSEDEGSSEDDSEESDSMLAEGENAMIEKKDRNLGSNSGQSRYSVDCVVKLPQPPTWLDSVHAIIDKTKISMCLLNQTKVERILPKLMDNGEHNRAIKSSNETNTVQYFEEALRIYQEVQALPQPRFSTLNFCYSFPKYFDLHKKVTDGGGFTMIDNFLPDQIALNIESILTNLHGTSWSPTKASEDYTNNNIAHVFMGSKNYPYAKQIQKLFHQLDPQQEFTFQAGRYTKGHFIDPHDDNATKIVDQIQYRRTMALVYYVTRNWTHSDGGLFVDMFQGREKQFVPKFNSLVAFYVPRQHKVTPVISDKTRYSLFGWFLEPVENA